VKKTTVKAKAAKPATHAKASAAKPAAKPASSAKHTTTSKHKATTTKHKATAKHTTTKKRTLSPGDVGCCTAEALAMSLRLQGVRVADEDVLALYWHTASDPEAGASIVATLEAAWRFGLGGVRPAWLAEEVLDYPPLPFGQRLRDRLKPDLSESDDLIGFRPVHGTSLILGVEMPGPHTLLAAPDGLWSWGEPFNPSEWPGMVVEEAWAVTWTS
jgi:hypothetical protein